MAIPNFDVQQFNMKQHKHKSNRSADPCTTHPTDDNNIYAPNIQALTHTSEKCMSQIRYNMDKCYVHDATMCIHSHEERC